MRVLFFFCMLALFSGCSFDEKNNITIRKWYYNDGTLMKEQEYINDSIEHGKYRYYYLSGQLKDSAQKIKGKIHGKRYAFYENGQLHAVSNYFYGKARNGIRYYKDGSLDVYKAFTYTEDLVFIVYFDSLGRYKSHDGNLIHSWIQEEKYPIGEKFSIELLVANPPNCYTELEVVDFDVVDNVVLSKNTYVPDQYNRVIYNRKQKPDKDLCFLHVVNALDSVGFVKYVDTLVIMVNKDGISTFSREFFRKSHNK